MEEEDFLVLVCQVAEEHHLLVFLVQKELAWQKAQEEEVLMILHWLQLVVEVSYPELAM